MLYANTAKAASECTYDWIAPGQRSITPGQVIGSPGQRLGIRIKHPQNSITRDNEKVTSGYLITGDKVDVVTTCESYSYVRYHGRDKTTTGWVDSARVEALGKRFISRPLEASGLCKAAERDFNSHVAAGKLTMRPMTPADEQQIARLNHDNGDSRPAALAPITVDGRKLIAVSYDTGGSASSSEILIWNSDLTARLTPADVEDRNPDNNGGNGPLFAVDQALVEVMGRPMIWTYDRGTTGYLSVIDRTGDIVPVCQIDQVPAQQPTVKTGQDFKVCPSLAKGGVTRIAMQTIEPSSTTSSERPSHGVINTDDHSSATYVLSSKGVADLDNSGRKRPVGIVSYAYDSGAGSGAAYRASVPMFLDADGNADLGDATNKKLFESFPEDVQGAFLFQFDGSTYVALTPAESGPPREVWMINGQAPKKMCEYRVTSYRVRLIEESRANE